MAPFLKKHMPAEKKMPIVEQTIQELREKHGA